MRFYVGLHNPAHASRFERSFISINRLRKRRSDFPANEWILDSGAFTEITRHGRYREHPAEYAEQVERWSKCGRMVAAVSQDYMCEPVALQRTGRTIEEHQALTIERYRELRSRCRRAYIMPVLQGWDPEDYVRHIREYGPLLRLKAWVGVGSVCRRNGKPLEIERILTAIAAIRPDLRLHAFGLKLTALSSHIVRHLLFSADSMAWSWQARRQGRSPNDPAEAKRFVERVERQPYQQVLFLPRAA